MALEEKIKSHPLVVDYFKEELPFYNKDIEKTKVKRLKNTDLLSEILFHEDINAIKINHALRGYAMSYKDQLVGKKMQLNS